MRLVVIAWSALAACSFSPRAGDAVPSDASPIDVLDADVEPDVAITAVCTLATGAPATAGALGNPNQGNNQPDINCPAGRVPIGFAFYATPTVPPGVSQEMVVNTHVRCGTITRFSDGTYATTPDVVASFTLAQCNNFPAANAGTELLCPQGMVVVGLTGNEAQLTSSGTRTLFNTVKMQCAALDAAGAPTGSPSTVAFTDTANHADQLQTASCPAGQIAHHFSVTSGCGQDSLGLSCAPSTCQ